MSLHGVCVALRRVSLRRRRVRRRLSLALLPGVDCVPISPRSVHISPRSVRISLRGVVCGRADRTLFRSTPRQSAFRASSHENNPFFSKSWRSVPISSTSATRTIHFFPKVGVQYQYRQLLPLFHAFSLNSCKTYSTRGTRMCVYHSTACVERSSGGTCGNTADVITFRFRAKREQLKTFQGLGTQSQGQNLAVTVLCVPYLLDSR